jgi:hypothetical protein
MHDIAYKINQPEGKGVKETVDGWANNLHNLVHAITIHWLE